GQHGAQNALAPGVDRPIARWTLVPPVAGEVLGMAVGIAVAIGLVVLFVVADDVVAGEAIMRSEVVDGCPGPPEPPVKEIGRAGHARGQLRPHAGLPPPETPHRIAKAIIPFGEARGMIAQLVTVRTDIPGFRNQLEPR